MKILPPALPALFLAAALPSFGLAAERPEGIAAAEAIAKAALGADCDMNGMEEVPMVGPEAEGFGHALYRFTYKPDYDPNGPGVEATLYQLFCGSGAYNIRNAFVLQTSDADTPKLIAFAKANPGKVRYCSTGVGTALHIEMAIFQQKQGVRFTHVPYPTGQTAPDLINGDLHFCSLNIIQTRPMVAAGQIRPLIITTDARLPDFPDTPTMTELGMPELNANYWGALFAPSKTPPAVLAKLHEAINKAQEIPEVKERFRSNQMIPYISPTIEDAKKWNAAEIDRWRTNFKNSGITVE
ncbi:MAG: tripartite tricarboxylate transporter substrate binding protein [Proteobacteria bacterium]|nr:tripartite tricarboxylate transporter substrate binding protein [Pseudomonadota bacterium]